MATVAARKLATHNRPFTGQSGESRQSLRELSYPSWKFCEKGKALHLSAHRHEIPLSERALKHVRFPLSHVLTVIASPALTGQFVRVRSFGGVRHVGQAPSRASAGARSKRTTTVTTGSATGAVNARSVA